MKSKRTEFKQDLMILKGVFQIRGLSFKDIKNVVMLWIAFLIFGGCIGGLIALLPVLSFFVAQAGGYPEWAAHKIGETVFMVEFLAFLWGIVLLIVWDNITTYFRMKRSEMRFNPNTYDD